MLPSFLTSIVLKEKGVKGCKNAHTHTHTLKEGRRGPSGKGTVRAKNKKREMLDFTFYFSLIADSHWMFSVEEKKGVKERTPIYIKLSKKV
jgi:hypothetical protein